MLTLAISLLLQLTQPQDPPILGLVATPGHLPLVDAEVLLRPIQRTQLLVLQGLAPATENLIGRTDRRGGYRLAGEQGPGVLLVRHRDGLGALAAAYPGAAQRILAEPMAAVVSASGPMRAWIQVALPGLGGVVLPVQEGREIRLPAGSYQAWIESERRLQRQRLALVSGREYPLAAPAAAERFIEPWHGFRGRVSPHSWPEVSLVEVAPGRFAVPDGAGLLEIREEIPDGETITEIWHPTEPPVLRLDEPARRSVTVTVRAAGGEPLGGAEIWALGSSAGGVQTLCRVVTGPRGEADLVLPTGREVQLVALHPDWPPRPSALPAEASSAVLAMSPARAIRVRVETPAGLGVISARVELEPGGNPWGRLVAYTDDRGLARFDRVAAGPIAVRLLDSRFLPAEQSVGAAAEIRFQADLGSSVVGRAVLPSGQPAPRTLVTLRDPGGGELSERTVATDDRGRFHFTGLSPTALLVLFAAVDVDGITYSRQVSDVRPGDTDRLVELHPEDPVPPHKRRGGR